MRCPLKSCRIPTLIAFAVALATSSAEAAQDAHAAAAVQSSPAPVSPAGPRHWQGGLGLALGVPVGDFSENVDIAAGVTGQFDYGLGGSPFSLGAEGTLLFYGSESRHVPLVGFPDLSVRVETSNQMALLHGRLRAQRRQGRVRPYVDALVGFNYLSTTTRVDADEVCVDNGSCDDDSRTDIDDLVLSAGGGAGVTFGFGAGPYTTRLDIGVRYLYGGEAEYLTEGGILRGGDPAALEPHRSRTDMVMIYIGVAFGR
jgi:hypothetical protein